MADPSDASTNDVRRSELMRIGARFRQLREQAGMTQAEVGRLAELHRVNVSRFESGLVDVGVSKVVALTTAVGASPAALWSAGFDDCP